LKFGTVSIQAAVGRGRVSCVVLVPMGEVVGNLDRKSTSRRMMWCTRTTCCTVQCIVSALCHLHGSRWLLRFFPANDFVVDANRNMHRGVLFEFAAGVSAGVAVASCEMVHIDIELCISR
jgi:hypothetical protein